MTPNRTVLLPMVALAAACGKTPDPVTLAPEPGERHLRNIRQLTFGGNNAEAYFSPDGKRLIFQRQENADSGCDQQYVINTDGSGLRRVSNGLGRTTCGYFYEGGRRILYSSTSPSSTASRCSARTGSGWSSPPTATPHAGERPTSSSRSGWSSQGDTGRRRAP